MDIDQQTTPEPESEPGPEAVGQTPLLERLTNVILSPGQVFGEIRGVPVDPINWAVPLVISLLAGILYSVTVFSQAGVLENMRLQQEQQFEKEVEAGRMTARDAEELQGSAERFMTPKFMMLFGIAGVIFGTPIGWLVFAFLFHWLVRLASHSHIPFSKCFEVIGLSSLVSVVQALVNMLLVVITQNLAMTLSLALAFEEFDPTNRTHALAAEIDVIRIWYFAVIAVAWSRLTRHPVATCGAWIFVLWVSFRVSWILLFVRG